MCNDLEGTYHTIWIAEDGERMWPFGRQRPHAHQVTSLLGDQKYIRVHQCYVRVMTSQQFGVYTQDDKDYQQCAEDIARRKELEDYDPRAEELEPKEEHDAY